MGLFGKLFGKKDETSKKSITFKYKHKKSGNEFEMSVGEQKYEKGTFFKRLTGKND